MSAATDFRNFVERQKRPAPVYGSIDWGQERDEWLQYLRQLYNYISGYLEEFIKDGAITIRESLIEINEENIGVYQAKRLAIIIGSQEITLTPIGTLLIGSKGRVDVEGSAGSSRLVLIDKNISSPRQMFSITVTTLPAGGVPASPPPSRPPPEKIDWAWKIVSRPPAMQFIELNKDSFYQMLMEVSNG